MKKKVILMILIFASVLSTLLSGLFNSALATSDAMSTPKSSSTNVGGYITTNTTWTLDGSPYVVASDIVVVANVFLTIEPGVVVRFAAARNLIIDGSLIAEGNSTHRITFTSNMTIPAMGDWGSIEIRNYGTISYSTVEYASTGIIFESTGTLAQSLIRSNVLGVYSLTANILIDGVEVTANDRGIANNGDESQPPQYEITVKNSYIHGNSYGITHSMGRLVIRNCGISENNAFGVFTSAWPTWTDVYDSSISNNKGNGFWGEGSGTYTTVYNSSISNNVGYGVGSWVIAISNSTVAENNYGVIGAVVKVSYSTVTSNKKYGVFANPHGIEIFGSEISFNLGSGIFLNVGETREIHYSKIFSNTVYDVENHGTYDINATYNWWGTTDETLINQHIYDYFDDYNYGRVVFIPYLDSEMHLHDVAVTRIELSRQKIQAGQTLRIKVYTDNYGDQPESFNVVVYANSTTIGILSITNLLPRTQITLTLKWETANVAPGNYVISALAIPVPNEGDTTDNFRIDGSVRIYSKR